MTVRDNIRNVAIIAHVDHGKTTLVDELLKTSGTFRSNQNVVDRVMDSGDIERERGITILSKNTAVDYKNYKINIIDTPGHADFGGEVERVLKMASGVVLVVDAFEGTMPQTKFVLSKALELDLPVIVCVNKIDRAEARPEEVREEVLELFIEMNAKDSYIDSPFVFSSARNGYATLDYREKGGDMSPLLDKIIDYIPKPDVEEEGAFKILISTTDYSDYQGRIGIGRIERGRVVKGQQCLITNYNDPGKKISTRVEHIYEFSGLDRVEVESSEAGNIVAITGVEGISIGDTLASPEDSSPLSFVKISEPTLAVTFSVNNSPFAGTEGEFVTSRQIRARLYRELETDVSLRVEDTDSTDAFKVSGRGELHLSVLIEKMRREGYEFLISKPEIIYKEVDGKVLEPIEKAQVNVSEEFSGTVIEELGKRRGVLELMEPAPEGGLVLIFKIPSRGLIGFRQDFLSKTRGMGILNTELSSYEEKKGDIPRRVLGSITSHEEGEATSYGLQGAERRGRLFISPGEKVYTGMVIGSTADGMDVDVNVCRRKQGTNIRAAGSDDAIILSPAHKMSLEEMLEFIEDDELIEVTPKSLRLRKRILDAGRRQRSRKD